MLKLDYYDYFLICFIVLISIFNIYLSYNISLRADEGTHLILSEFYRDLIINSWKLKFNFNKLYEFGINYLIHYPKLTITYLPLYHLNVALLFFLDLDPIFGRLVSIIYFILTSILIYLISINFFNKKTGIFAVLLFSLSPTVFWAISKASIDYTAFFFCFLAIYLFLKYMRNNEKVYFIYLGIISFLCFFARNFAVFPLLSILSFIVFFRKKERIKKILLIIVPFSILFIPFMFFYIKIGGLGASQSLLKQTEEMPWVQYNLLAPFFYFYNYTIETYGLGIIVFLVAFFYLYKEIKIRKNITRDLFFILWFIFAYIILTYLQNPRYVAYLLMPLIFVTGYYFSKIKLKYTIPFFIIFIIIVGWNSYQDIKTYQKFTNLEKKISKYLYDRGGNIGLLSDDPIYSSVFIYYISSFDTNKTLSVYRPCFFYHFLNKSKDVLVNEMTKNKIKNILVTENSSDYKIIESIKEYIDFNTSFQTDNFTFDVYSVRLENQTQEQCNYICSTNYYLCTNYTSPLEIK